MDQEQKLSAVLSEFARTLVTEYPIQSILDHLVERIVDLLPIDAAGVTLISATTRPRLLAGSDESAVRYEDLQTALDEGPCLAAYESDEPILVPDLAVDDRFPRFAKAALDEGLAAVFTFPLRNEDRCLGALDLYRRTPGVLDAHDMAAAQTLADVATAYLLNSEARSLKTELVTTVSHELRTPMTSIAGFVELLQDGEGGQLTAEQEAFVEAIRRNSDRLTALANDLLKVSGLEAVPTHRQHEPLDLGALVTASRDALERVIAARDLDVTFDVPPEPVPVCGDETDLESLVTNLVTNALKFTEDGGKVQCALFTAEGTARLEVRDNGLGIPEDEQEGLFTRFFRSSTAQQYAIQGTGLGLTIVDSIVRRHGGHISVESRHLEGSTFTVDLPLNVA